MKISFTSKICQNEIPSYFRKKNGFEKIFRLYLFNEAEMRRSRLVERANTEDEDEELDSWGSDTDSEVDPKETEDNLEDKPEAKTDAKKSSTEDIGPDGPEDKSKMTLL